MRPRLQSGAFARPLNFTVRRLAMPIYDVVVQGRGIKVPVGDAVAVGFFRTFRVAASDPVQAEQRAVTYAFASWNAGPNRRLKGGEMPSFKIDSVIQLPWWRRFGRKSTGYAFYSTEDGS